MDQSKHGQGQDTGQDAKRKKEADSVASAGNGAPGPHDEFPPELAAQAKDSGTGIMLAPDLEPVLGRVLGLLGDGLLRQVVVCPFAAALPLSPK